jgi:uncharacterized protein (TIGR02147 family)
MDVDVLEFLEYREYLRDWYAESKRQHRFTSYRYLAQKTGIDPAWIVRVFQKEGHLAEESLPAFIRLCALDERRAEYFRVLYRFCKSKSPEDQREHYKRMMELREVVARRLASPELVYFSDWSIVALRALIGISQDTSDIEGLGKRLSPPVLPGEARNALDVLSKLGLVTEDGKGGYDITDRMVTSGTDIQSMAVRQYHRRTLELAQESLDRHPPEERDISSVTLTLHHDDMPEIKERITEFRRGLLQFARSSEGADRVYHLNVSVFPLSQIVADPATSSSPGKENVV